MDDELLFLGDTAPELSGTAISNLPRAWIRSTAMLTAATLATSGDWFPFYEDPEWDLGESIPLGYLYVPPSEELEHVQAALTTNFAWWQGLSDRPVPVEEFVLAIERDLIRVRAVEYRNPAGMIALLGAITAAIGAKFDALLDPRGYLEQVRARHRAEAARAGRDERRAQLEYGLGGPSLDAYVEMRAREGVPVDLALQQVRWREQHEASRLLLGAILPALNEQVRNMPGEPVAEDILEYSALMVAERLLPSDEDVRAVQALVALEPTVTTGHGTDPGVFFHPPA